MDLRSPFDGFVEKAVRASTTCLIMADHNRYSIDARAAGRMVLVRSHAERIVVLFNDEMVADHPRSFRRDQTIYDPWHYLPVLLKKPGALRNGAPFKNWHLPPAWARSAPSSPSMPMATASSSRSWGPCPSMGWPPSRPPVPRRWRRDSPPVTSSWPSWPATPAGPATQHHHARCIAPEDRAGGRL